jgi:hypothetical protein
LNIEPIIAQHDSNEKFWTVTQDDEIVCPLGHPALPTPTTRHRHGKEYTVLQVLACPKCQFHKSCSPSGSYRTLSIPAGCDPIDKLNCAYRARSPEGKLAMTERMATIERVFAQIKANQGFDRFDLKGKKGARIEWLLLHLARNLKILAKAMKIAPSLRTQRLQTTFIVRIFTPSRFHPRIA